MVNTQTFLKNYIILAIQGLVYMSLDLSHFQFDAIQCISFRVTAIEYRFFGFMKCVQAGRIRVHDRKK